MDYKSYFFKGQKGGLLPDIGYTSANTTQLSVAEITTLLLSLEEVKMELAQFGKA